MSRMRERRPTRSPSSQSSRALRTTAWRAADGVKPSSFRLADQRLLPRAVGARQEELAEDREQRRAGGGRADGAASQDVFH